MILDHETPQEISSARYFAERNQEQIKSFLNFLIKKYNLNYKQEYQKFLASRKPNNLLKKKNKHRS